MSSAIKLFLLFLACGSIATYADEEHDEDGEHGDDAVTACEGEVAHLNCSGGQVVHIAKVFYGRRDVVTCSRDSSSYNWESGCYSLNAIDVVSSMCNNLSECHVTSTRDLFSDPCHGVSTYLEIEYTCIDQCEQESDVH